MGTMVNSRAVMELAPSPVESYVACDGVDEVSVLKVDTPVGHRFQVYSTHCVAHPLYFPVYLCAVYGYVISIVIHVSLSVYIYIYIYIFTRTSPHSSCCMSLAPEHGP